MKRNPALEQRLRFIDLMLDTYGTFNRITAEDFFGISTPQVSLDIAAYIEVAPQNIEYNRQLKAYVRTAQFQRAFA
jgi:hypothetical protein